MLMVRVVVSVLFLMAETNYQFTVTAWVIKPFAQNFPDSKFAM
jgi:hypothetical protein